MIPIYKKNTLFTNIIFIDMFLLAAKNLDILSITTKNFKKIKIPTDFISHNFKNISAYTNMLEYFV